MRLDVTTEEGYTIACALRGPDRKDTAVLKRVFTARFRELVGLPGAEYVVRRFQLSEAAAISALVEAREWYTQDQRGYNHYIHHCTQAASALGDWELSALAHHFVQIRVDTKPTVEDIIRLGGGDASEG